MQAVTAVALRVIFPLSNLFQLSQQDRQPIQIIQWLQRHNDRDHQRLWDEPGPSLTQSNVQICTVIDCNSKASATSSRSSGSSLPLAMRWVWRVWLLKRLIRWSVQPCPILSYVDASLEPAHHTETHTHARTRAHTPPLMYMYMYKQHIFYWYLLLYITLSYSYFFPNYQGLVF